MVKIIEANNLHADRKQPECYVERINESLRPSSGGPLVLDLFAGCGGLALGFEALGFETVGYEMDADAAKTYEANLLGSCHNVKLTPEFGFPKAQVVIGGPPCQPFSVGGHQHGIKDARDGFPIFISAVRQAQPDIWMFENVRGLLYRNKWYLQEVVAELESLGYRTHIDLLNAVNFGVPQNRERVIVFGFKKGFYPPQALASRVTAGEALMELAFDAPSNGRYLTASMDAYVLKYEIASKCINPRDLHLDRPARTLTCRNLAGATGDMHRVRLPDGRRRRLSVREAARLQSFPDWFNFVGNESSQFKQLGNAVAPLFAHALASAVAGYLSGSVQNDGEGSVAMLNGNQLSMELLEATE
jgi:DNA (cytosine-5)-methyltransferase 1